MEKQIDYKDLTVAMITMNEEKAVGKVIDDIHRIAPGAEVLVVDSSKDRTADIAQEHGARVIRQFPPKGYGPAMDMALSSAAGKVIITLDCDDTYPTERIPELAQYVMDGGYDLVDGCRLRKKPAAMPLMNYFANLGFGLIASLFFFRFMTDLHSGMRAYRKSMLDKLRPSINPKGDALPVELLVRPIKAGYKVKIVQIDYRLRIGESKMNPLRSAYWTLKRILTVRFS